MKSVEIAAATLVRLSGLENENEERKVEKFSNGKMANRRRRQPTKCQNRIETSKYSSGQRCICAATIDDHQWRAIAVILVIKAMRAVVVVVNVFVAMFVIVVVVAVYKYVIVVDVILIVIIFDVVVVVVISLLVLGSGLSCGSKFPAGMIRYYIFPMKLPTLLFSFL